MEERKGKEISFAGKSMRANYRKILEGNLGEIILAQFPKKCLRPSWRPSWKSSKNVFGLELISGDDYETYLFPEMIFRRFLEISEKSVDNWATKDY